MRRLSASVCVSTGLTSALCAFSVPLTCHCIVVCLHHWKRYPISSTWTIRRRARAKTSSVTFLSLANLPKQTEGAHVIYRNTPPRTGRSSSTTYVMMCFQKRRYSVSYPGLNSRKKNNASMQPTSV